MPVAVHISPQHMSKADYERLIKELQESGHGDPEGRLSHTAYGEDEVHVFEVWESPEQFEAHRDRLYSVYLGSGVDAGTIDVMPVHSEHPD